MIVFGAACWTLSIVFFVGQAIAQAASARPYSLATNLISDLGNTSCGPDICSPFHGFMNAVFVAVGMLHLLGAVASVPAWPWRPMSTVGVGLVGVAGIGLITVGLAPENQNLTPHTIGAFVGLVSLNLAMIVLGSVLIRAVRWLGIMAYAAGIAGFIGLGMWLNHAAVPAGVAERIADYPGAAMIVVLGAFLLVAAIRQRTLALSSS